MSFFLKKGNNTNFSHKMIPDQANSGVDWNKVYFGKFEGKPLKWRVISKSTTLFSNLDFKSFFLDCDSVIKELPFYEDFYSKNYSWHNSFLRVYLNNSFKEGFTNLELNAVGGTTVNKNIKTGDHPSYEDLSAESFFIPDYSELPGDLNSNKYFKYDNKSSEPVAYWLRSYSPERNGEKLGAILKPFKMPLSTGTNIRLQYLDKEKDCGLSPSFCINTNKVLLSTKVADDTYKFTILDDTVGLIKVEPDSKVKIENRKVTIPYSTFSSRKGYNSVSVMILDDVYMKAEPRINTSGANMRYYEILKTPDNFSDKGTVSFNLPPSLLPHQWGEKYHVYLLLEEINGEDETDYVALPCEITANQIEGYTCKVTYYYDLDSKNTYTSQEVVKGRCATPPSTPSREDYDFVEWIFPNGEAFDFSSKIIKDTKLYGSWKKKPEKPKLIPYYIWVGETQITSENAGDVFGNGKVVYDRDKKTLTFNDAYITSYTKANGIGYFLQIHEDLTILGKAQLGSSNERSGIYVAGDVTLDINADLLLPVKEYGIFSFNAKEIRISGGQLNISGASYGIFAGGNTPINTVLNIAGGSVEIESKTCGISALNNSGKITVADTLNVLEPRRFDIIDTSIEDQDVIAMGYETGQVAKHISIVPGSIIVDFELEDGLEYNTEKRRYEHVYTTEDIKPKVCVRVGRENPYILREGVDYTVSYSNNQNVTKEDSPAVVTISYNGDFKGTSKLYFHILPKDIGNTDHSGPSEGIIITDVLKVENDYSVTMFYNGHKVESKNYYVSDHYNRDDASYTYSLNGKGNYIGYFYVACTSLSKTEADNKKIVAHLAYTYDGEPKVFTADQLTARDGNGKPITADNYFVEYEDNIDVGLAKAHVAAKSGSGYYGESIIYYEIMPDKNKSAIKAEVIGKFYYVSDVPKPRLNVTATLGNKTRVLEENKDYRVEYSRKSNNPLQGIYRIYFKGNYEGRIFHYGEYTMLPAPFKAGNVVAAASDLVYTEPGDYRSKVYVAADGELLKSENYTIRYLVGDEDITDNPNFTLKGNSAAVTIVLKGRNCYEENEVRIKNCYYIKKATSSRTTDLSTAQIVLKGTTKAIPTQAFTGRPIEPEIDLLFKHKSSRGNILTTATKLGLREGTDYKVYYFDNVKRGGGFVFVKALSNKGKAINSTSAKFTITKREP